MLMEHKKNERFLHGAALKKKIFYGLMDRSHLSPQMKTGENLPPAHRNDVLGLLFLSLHPPCLSSQSTIQPGHSQAHTYQCQAPAAPRPPSPLSTSSRGGEARLESPLSLLSDCLSLSSARRLLLLQMDDWSGSLPTLAKQAHF